MSAAIRIIVITFVILLEFAHSAQDIIDAKMLRYPDVSRSGVVFVYAEDIWIVGISGGIARRLTSAEGQELFPKFSPDNKYIAFSGNYDGNTDIYTMPSAGGEVKRLTFHPDDDYMVEWYPDSANILYKSEMMSFVRRFNRFFKIKTTGGLPEALPLPYGEHASFGSGDDTLFFQYITREDRTWKRYTGGMTSDIWKYNFTEDRATKITNYEGSDSLPMWNGRYLYFLSDRGKNRRNNIWKTDPATGDEIQVTSFDTYDVKWPGIGDGYIVFENGGKLFLIDTANDELRELHIEVTYDLPEVRPEFKNLSKFITNYGISPDGGKALFEARGEVFIYDIDNTYVKNITNSSGSAERYPSWSYDSSKIAYFSDASGEYELIIEDLKKKEKKSIKLENGFYYRIVWSPDGKKVAFSNNTGSLFISYIEKNKTVEVDKDEWLPIEYYSWSPDSRWLTYSKKMDNFQSSVFIYDLGRDNINLITNEFYNDVMPVFSDNGEYLAFYSDRFFKPVYSDMDDTWIYPNSTELFIITLRKDTKSPFLPGVKPNENNGNGGKVNSSKVSEYSGRVKIDFKDIDNRIIKIPVSPGNFKGIKFIGNRIFYLRGNNSGSLDSKKKGFLKYYDLTERKEKNLINNINAFDISTEGKRYLYKSGNKYGVLSTDKKGKVGDGLIDSKKISGSIDYRKEWVQIFNEAWRIERDFFYDPNMHGTDWIAIRNKYFDLLKHVVSRRDLNYLIGEMIGELNSSHTYVRGGDLNEPTSLKVGMLGCDFGYDNANGLYFFKKIYGDANSQSYVRSPLRSPGLNIGEGDYLLKVNGRELDANSDPLSAFQGLEGEVVELTINKHPGMKNSRNILIKTINRNHDLKLRFYSWVEDNRLKVDKLSNGKIGYIYVPDTSAWGQNELVRQLVPQKNKPGLIIDERFNSGGQIPDRFIELLNRPVYNYWARRDQNYLKTPFFSHQGPKIMLVNGWSGSGGDAFPYYFKKAGLGEIVGRRTLGGLIGIGGYPRLIDGGSVTVPGYAFFDTNGKWGVEGYGVDPDYDIDNISSDSPGSSDPQLAGAIDILMKKLSSVNHNKVAVPVYPDRSGNHTSH